tara:strand:- start:25 stop:1122 length:1098 start_codon:yes stop_codon:yes gene_type:complete
MIPLMKVHTPPNIGKKIQEVWDSGFVTEGEYSDKFEKLFGDYIGNPNVSLMNSCTSAIWLSGHMCDVQPGDEVITTAMTSMATNVPFINMGATLKIADINPKTGNIDPKSIESLISKKTKAIIIVHWAGLPCDLDEICNIGRKHNIKIIEDAAHALRSTYDGKQIGNHGDFICFSFQAVKHLTTADGGALVCKSKEDIDRVRKLRWFGLDRHAVCDSRWNQEINEAGYKFHMNNMNACIGIEQLKYIDKLIDRHISNSKYYDKNIDNDNIELLQKSDRSESSSWFYTILTENKTDLQKYLKNNGISSDTALFRNDRYKCMEKFRNNNLVGLDYFENRMLNLPVGWWVSNAERNHIVEVINRYLLQ